MTTLEDMPEHILKMILDKTIRNPQRDKHDDDDNYHYEYDFAYDFGHYNNYLWSKYYSPNSSGYWLEKASKSDVLTCIVHNRQVPGKVLIQLTFNKKF